MQKKNKILSVSLYPPLSLSFFSPSFSRSHTLSFFLSHSACLSLSYLCCFNFDKCLQYIILNIPRHFFPLMKFIFIFRTFLVNWYFSKYIQFIRLFLYVNSYEEKKITLSLTRAQGILINHLKEEPYGLSKEIFIHEERVCQGDE